jgi:hypothetical protein
LIFSTNTTTRFQEIRDDYGAHTSIRIVVLQKKFKILFHISQVLPREREKTIKANRIDHFFYEAQHSDTQLGLSFDGMPEQQAHVQWHKLRRCAGERGERSFNF